MRVGGGGGQGGGDGDGSRRLGSGGSGERAYYPGGFDSFKIKSENSIQTAIVAPPRRKPSPAFARAHAAAASRARRQHARRRGPVRAPQDSDSSKQTVHSCHSISGPLLQRRKHPEQGGCGDAACGSWPARDDRFHQSAPQSRVTCKRGLRGCSLWKLACERFSIQQYQRSNIANRLQKGVSGEAACGSWPARDRHISPANPLYPAFQSSIRLRRAQHCNASRMRPPQRPDRTLRATLHALHMSTRAALHFYF